MIHYLHKRIKWWWQRRTRGFDDRELWNLDLTVAKFILPRLKQFSKKIDGYPPELCQPTVWSDMLDDMIFTFESKIKNFPLGFDPEDQDYKKKLTRYRRGLVAFSRFYDDLWK